MIHYLPTAYDMAEKISEALLFFLRNESDQHTNIHIALSGGSTPRKFFEQLALKQNNPEHPDTLPPMFSGIINMQICIWIKKLQN